MKQKPNLTAIENYAKQLAESICEDFFSNHKVITGKEVLSLTKVEQINLFVVQHIFEAWQKEAVRIRSPFFDYTATSVKKAFHELMNELSKNIQVEKEGFENILQQAITDTLLLLVSPPDYYTSLLDRQGGSQLPVQNYLKPLFVYIKLYKSLAEDILSSVDKEQDNQVVELEDIKEIASEATSKIDVNTESAIIEVIDKLNSLLPIKYEEIIEHEIEENQPEAFNPLAFDTNIFDEPSTEENNSNTTENTSTEEEENPVFYQEAVQPEGEQVETTETQITEEEIHVEEDNQETYGTPAFEDPSYTYKKSVENQDTPETKEEEETSSAPENDSVKEVSEPKQEEEPQETEDLPLHERLARSENQEKKQPTLLDKLRQNQEKTKNLGRAIPLNKRFLFRDELFGGSVEELDAAIALVDQSKDYHTAINHLKTNYAKRHNWDYTAEVTIEFLGLVDDQF